MNQNILITGVSGYLGSHIAKKLHDKGYAIFGLVRKTSKLSRIEPLFKNGQLIVLQGDFASDSLILEKAFRDSEFQTIIHCATSYGRKNESAQEVRYANVELPMAMVNLGLKHSLKVFVNTHTLLDRPTNTYSQTKYEFWDYLKEVSNRIKVYNMSLEHFYGPGDDPSKFISWLIKNFLEGTKEMPLTLGEQKRDFVYIDDVVDAYFVLLQKVMANAKEIGPIDFEIGTGVLTTIRDAVLLTHRLCGSPPIRFDFGRVPYRPAEKMEFKVDLEAIRSLGWTAKTEFKTGLERTILFEFQRKSGV